MKVIRKPLEKDDKYDLCCPYCGIEIFRNISFEDCRKGEAAFNPQHLCEHLILAHTDSGMMEPFYYFQDDRVESTVHDCRYALASEEYGKDFDDLGYEEIEDYVEDVPSTAVLDDYIKTLKYENRATVVVAESVAMGCGGPSFKVHDTLIFFDTTAKVADPNNDEFECEDCERICDIEDSHKTAEHELICQACFEKRNRI
jgi:hypothetical protein